MDLPIGSWGDAVPTLRLLLLGTPRLEKDDTPFKLSRRKAFALLAYLAVQGGYHTREALAALFWPESDTQLAYSYLRRELAVLNKELDGSWLRSDRESIELVGGDDFWLDVDHFRRLLAACGTHGHPPDEVCPECMPLLSDAVALYRDDFMTGFSLPDSPDFDDWQRFECESLHHELIGALKRLVYGHIGQGELDAAIYYARHWLSLDPWHEPAHRELMQLYAWSGDWSAALRQYQECVRVLGEELSQPPEEATRVLYEAIQSKQLAEPPVWTPYQPGQAKEEQPILVDFPDAGPQHNLPVEVTPFFDREQDLAEIRYLLLDKPGCRLLTLVGPGGIGKTRLAAQAAMQALHAFPHGIFMVPLAPIDSTDLLVPTIADVLRLPFRGRAEPKVQLLNYLREKEVLLVLDNFEHVLEGACLLADMLYAAPGIKLLVTSRERLKLREEWVREIGGLPYPIEEEMKTIQAGAALEDYPAVSLFLENARRTHPSYSLSEPNQAAVVRICQLVEGMPLCLELASAWVSFMPTWEIAQEIDHNLDILSTTLRNIPERHRSVRALFDHSYQLLTEEERRVIRQLSVFRGGFEREAAEYVTGASLPLLVGLVNKSVLRGDPSGRYDQHELLREYLMDELEEVAMEHEDTRDRQCSYYAAFLQAREPYLRGLGQDEALDEIGAEIDNVRAAWRWAVAQHKVPELSQLLESLYLFYDARSWVQEGEEAFRLAAESLGESAEARSEAVSLLLAQFLGRQGRFTYRLGRYREAKRLIEEDLHILDSLESRDQPAARTEKAFSLRNLGSVMRGDGEYQQAQQLYEESLVLFRECGDDLGTAGVLKQLGILAGSLGEYLEAQRLLREALELYQAMGDQYGVANILNDLGIVADRTGQYAEAQQLYQDCLAIRRRIGHRWGVGTTLNNLGYLAFAQGQYSEAKQLLEESLAIQREIGDRYQIANCLSNLGATVREQGDYDLARGNFSEALTSASEIGAVPLVLELLDGVARLLAASQPGKEELVAQLFAVVMDHPASDKPTKDGAQRGLAELSAQLTPDAIVAAQEQARGVDLEVLVDDVLAEIG
jgi:predicted ATPase/DNA-binding SARP family transcriptional activator/uncharacterized protein HemY